jgi:hypothetical protein
MQEEKNGTVGVLIVCLTVLSMIFMTGFFIRGCYRDKQEYGLRKLEIQTYSIPDTSEN